MRSSKQRSRSKPNRPRTMGNIVNRVFDSSGPEGKVRGTPQQIIEKYQLLARDAQLSNDRVAYENFLQHSEHYTRMLGEANREMQREADERRETQGNGQGNGQGSGQQNGQHRPFGIDQGQPGLGDDSDLDYSDQPRPQTRDYAARDYQSRDQQGREQQGRDQQGRDQQGRDQQSRDQQSREPREYQPRDQQNRDQQNRDQPPREKREYQPRDQRQAPAAETAPSEAARDPLSRDQQPREPKRDQPKREPQPPRQPQPRSVISPMMPDLSAMGVAFEPEGDADTGLVETPETKPAEPVAAKAPRRRAAPRKPKAEGETGFAAAGSEVPALPEEAAE